MHVPKSQTLPIPQAMPHPPQFRSSQLVSVHRLPPQHVSQLRQVFPAQLHAPPAQVEGAMQVTPQEPQLLLSLFVSVQAPLQHAAVLPVQKTDPQLTTWQGLTIPWPASSGTTL
jgi:hypothetical protein